MMSLYHTSMLFLKAINRYPEIPELVNEFKIFGYEIGSTGTKTYRAPEGYHDDCVVALALAAWQLKEPAGGHWDI